MTKLRPPEVGYQNNPNGAHKLLAFHLLGLGFLLFMFFPLLFKNKKALEPHCNTFQRHVAATSLPRDKLPSPELVYFHFVCKQISIL